MRTSTKPHLYNGWIRTTDRLSERHGIRRPKVMLALLWLSVFALIGTDRCLAKSFAEISAMCQADGERTRDQCIADSCKGVCTADAARRCDRLGGGREEACRLANGIRQVKPEPATHENANGQGPGVIKPEPRSDKPPVTQPPTM